MSQYFSVHSRGAAYFAATQNSLAFMDAAHAPQADFNIGESGSLNLDIAFHSLPTLRVSADETHPLFTYFEAGPNGATILQMGVSPSGRLKCYNKGSAAEIQTAPGYIVPDGVFRKYQYTFLSNADFINGWEWDDEEGGFFHDVGPGLPFSTYASTALIGPSGSKLGQIALFNGKESSTRCACSIRYAILGMAFPGGASRLYWPFTEGRGTDLAPIQDPNGGTAFPFDATLAMQYRDPQVYPLLYGPVPDSSVRGAFRWDRHTIYRRRSLTPIEYRRVT